MLTEILTANPGDSLAHYGLAMEYSKAGQVEAAIREFKALMASDLKKEIEYRLFDGSPGKANIEDMILHVFSHGFHHRGQMAAMASKPSITGI